jgi:hypothetical protein
MDSRMDSRTGSRMDSRMDSRIGTLADTHKNIINTLDSLHKGI